MMIGEGMSMKKKVKVKMTCIATVYVTEDVVGNMEVDDIDEVDEIEDFEVIDND